MVSPEGISIFGVQDGEQEHQEQNSPIDWLC